MFGILGAENMRWVVVAVLTHGALAGFMLIGIAAAIGTLREKEGCTRFWTMLMAASWGIVVGIPLGIAVAWLGIIVAEATFGAS